MDIEIKKLAEEMRDYVVAMRREFHEHPEVSGKEFETRERLIRELDAMGVPYEKVPGTGLIAIIKGELPGDNKLLRADIDALPLQEESVNLKQPKVCVSQNAGACHACGHDAHMAMLLGTMKVLVSVRDRLKGTVYCAFEEGEETNCGIEAMIQALEKYPIDRCMALHVYNMLEAGKVNLVPGPRMAGTVRIGFHLKGKSGHGSRPDQAISPIIPGAHIISEINSAFNNQLNIEETVTLGFGMFAAGTAWNIIPDDAYITGNARYFDPVEGDKAFALINRTIKNVAEIHRCGVEFDPTHRISPLPVVNDAGVVERVRANVVDACGEEVLGDCDRWFASECYSAYLAKYPGALGLLGIRNEDLGSGAAHHNGQFDLDESALTLGVCTELAFALD